MTDFSEILEVFSLTFDSESPLIFTKLNFWIFFLGVLLFYTLLEFKQFVRVLVFSALTITASIFFRNGDFLVTFGTLALLYAFSKLIYKSDKRQKPIFWLAICLLTVLSTTYFVFKALYFNFHFKLHPLDFWLAILAFVFLLSLFEKKLIVRSVFLTLLSLFFYYKSSGNYLILLCFSLIVNYLLGNAIYSTESILRKKWIIAFSAIINILILGYFKYTYFFTDSFNTMFGTEFKPTNVFAEFANWIFGKGSFVTEILLPVGVSFFTFQSISYVVDIYRKEIKPVKNFFDYTFFVTFFPQLVAGPIVRARDFIPQIYQKYTLTKEDYSHAVIQIVTGLLKKIVLADFIAVNFIDLVASSPDTYPGFVSVLAMWGYSLQIYGDFSGYTDIAIGLSGLMGFKLLENFNSPYKAINVADFWRRWHKSLGSWLRDYLYIPLGGNRGGGLATYIATTLIFVFLIFITQWYELIYVYAGLMVVYFVCMRWIPSTQKTIFRDLNLLITMVVGGLWHGASENFVIWGAMNGVALVLYNHWKKFENPESNRWLWPHALKLVLLAMSLPIISILFNIFQNNVSTELIVFDGIINAFYLSIFLISISLIFSKMPAGIQRGYLRFWGIFITFNFITLTRIWFRLEEDGMPTKMLNQIINHYDFTWESYKLVITQYKEVFWVMLAGFIIHWLPSTWKNWYKMQFVKSPLVLQVLFVSIIILLMYQSMTGESKAFVYFQF